jgi:hypothetical protein
MDAGAAMSLWTLRAGVAGGECCGDLRPPKNVYGAKVKRFLVLIQHLVAIYHCMDESTLYAKGFVLKHKPSPVAAASDAPRACVCAHQSKTLSIPDIHNSFNRHHHKLHHP